MSNNSKTFKLELRPKNLVVQSVLFNYLNFCERFVYNGNVAYRFLFTSINSDIYILFVSKYLYTLIYDFLLKSIKKNMAAQLL